MKLRHATGGNVPRGLHRWHHLPEAGSACDCHGIREGYYCDRCGQHSRAQYPYLPDPHGCRAAVFDAEHLENFAGSGYCPGCHVAIDLHPLDKEGVDVGRCPTPREALDRLYFHLATLDGLAWEPAELVTPTNLGDYEIREGEYGPL